LSLGDWLTGGRWLRRITGYGRSHIKVLGILE
jgi:hypothetical protein